MLDMFFVNSIFTVYANEVQKGRVVNNIAYKMTAFLSISTRSILFQLCIGTDEYIVVRKRFLKNLALNRIDLILMKNKILQQNLSIKQTLYYKISRKCFKTHFLIT